MWALMPSSGFVLQLYYQIEQENVGDSLKQKGFSDLFDEVVQEPFFNQLR